MSIFVSKSLHPKILGIAQGLEYLGLEVTTQPDNYVLFDLIEEFKPTALLLNDHDISKKEVKFALSEYPDIKWVWMKEKDIKVDTSSLDLVLLLDNSVPSKEDEIQVPYMANDILYSQGKYDSKYETDVVIFSDKIDPENKRVVRWINQLGNSVRLKVFGLQKIPSVYYLGQLVREEYKNVIASSKILVSFDKEWFFNALINGITPLYLSSNEEEIHKKYQFSTYEELCSKCTSYLESPPVFEEADYIQTYTVIAKTIKEKLEL